MNRVISIISILVLMFFSACSENSSDTDVTHITTEEAPEKNRIIIDEKGFEMSILITEEHLAQGEPNIFFDQTVGYLKIRIADSFSLDIHDEDISTSEFKNKLRNDQLFSYEFKHENDSGFSYQALLPDGTKYSTNFIQTFELNGKKYYACGPEENEYSIEKVQKMKETILSIKPIQK